MQTQTSLGSLGSNQSNKTSIIMRYNIRDRRSSRWNVAIFDLCNVLCEKTREEDCSIISVTQYLAGGQPGLSRPVIRPTWVSQQIIIYLQQWASDLQTWPDLILIFDIFLLTDRRGGEETNLTSAGTRIGHLLTWSGRRRTIWEIARRRAELSVVTS